MKVLYFHQYFSTPKGMGGTRSYEMAQQLIRCGHQVTMVCADDERSGLDLPKAANGPRHGMVDGIEVYQFPLAYSNRLSLVRRAWLFLRFAANSVRLALKLDCDLLFATSTPLTAAIPGIAMKLLGRRKPFVFEVRDLWPELPRALGMRNPLLLGGMSMLEWAAYHSCVAAVGLSPGIVEGIRRRCPRDLPVAMIPNGCDLDLFRPELRQPLSLPGINPGDFAAGFTGAHGAANGLGAVLDAAAVLVSRGERRIKCVLIGDGKEKDRLVSRGRREGLENCLFLPPVCKTELASLTASLGCGLMILKNVSAFYHGTSPNKFFDYLAAGVPILNNYPGWLAQMIEAEGCGVVVPPDDPEAFADALIYLADHPAERLEMGRNARRLAERRFSRKPLAAEWVKFLEKQRETAAQMSSR